MRSRFLARQVDAIAGSPPPCDGGERVEDASIEERMVEHVHCQYCSEYDNELKIAGLDATVTQGKDKGGEAQHPHETALEPQVQE